MSDTPPLVGRVKVELFDVWSQKNNRAPLAVVESASKI